MKHNLEALLRTAPYELGRRFACLLRLVRGSWLDDVSYSEMSWDVLSSPLYDGATYERGWGRGALSTDPDVCQLRGNSGVGGASLIGIRLPRPLKKINSLCYGPQQPAGIQGRSTLGGAWSRHA